MHRPTGNSEMESHSVHVMDGAPARFSDDHFSAEFIEPIPQVFVLKSALDCR